MVCHGALLFLTIHLVCASFFAGKCYTSLMCPLVPAWPISTSRNKKPCKEPFWRKSTAAATRFSRFHQAMALSWIECAVLVYLLTSVTRDIVGTCQCVFKLVFNRGTPSEDTGKHANGSTSKSTTSETTVAVCADDGIQHVYQLSSTHKARGYPKCILPLMFLDFS